MFQPTYENYSFLQRCQTLDENFIYECAEKLSKKKCKNRSFFQFQVDYLKQVVRERSETMKVILLRLSFAQNVETKSSLN